MRTWGVRSKEPAVYQLVTLGVTLVTRCLSTSLWLLLSLDPPSLNAQGTLAGYRDMTLALMSLSYHIMIVGLEKEILRCSNYLRVKCS